ncbi:MAG: hypothetical protein AVDCRST_MAG60-2376, partial [uncultured Nocardioides sp.]
GTTRPGGLRRVRGRAVLSPAPGGVPHGRRAPARPGPPAGVLDQDVRRLATAARARQGRGLHPQGHHHHRDHVVPPEVLAGRAADRDAARGVPQRARRRSDAARVALGRAAGASPTPARGHRAALLRGPHRGADRCGDGLCRRHRQEPGLCRSRQAAHAARRGVRRPGSRASSLDPDGGDPM